MEHGWVYWDALSIARVGTGSGRSRTDAFDKPVRHACRPAGVFVGLDRPGCRRSSEIRIRVRGRPSPRGSIQLACGMNGEILHIFIDLIMRSGNNALSDAAFRSDKLGIGSFERFPDIDTGMMLPQS